MALEQEREFIELAITEAKESHPEDNRVHPRVGVVVVKDGKVVARAHRNDGRTGHAEYIALEHKLPPNETLAGATVYTTLEPCTTRNHPKIPCAERLIERKVGRVVIGMLDPNPQIRGAGQRRLRDANIRTDLFPAEFMEQVEDLNREFTRSHVETEQAARVDQAFIDSNRGRNIDEWYRTVNAIYWNRNFYCDEMNLFTHLVEVSGGLSLLASHKKKQDVDPETFVPKAVAWWMALCGKVRIRSVGEMIWTKFPGRCPYCQQPRHDNDECRARKTARPGPDWLALAAFGKDVAQKPKGLGQWQRMFANIYPVEQLETTGRSYARLCEELGELAEAIRVLPAAPGYFLSEAADVFAWLMHLQNALELQNGIDRHRRGDALEIAFCTAYPDYCVDCRSTVCKCPPILETTIGRIGHQMPATKTGPESDFMTSEDALATFQTKGR
jgi:pyrimidine deaminase RibD-like protein